MSKNTTLAQTYVWHGENAFYVSTINRQSSATFGCGRLYAETMVWGWDAETKQRGGCIGQDEHCADSLFAHQRMVQRLFDTGKCEDDIAVIAAADAKRKQRSLKQIGGSD